MGKGQRKRRFRKVGNREGKLQRYPKNFRHWLEFGVFRVGANCREMIKKSPGKKENFGKSKKREKKE